MGLDGIRSPQQSRDCLAMLLRDRSIELQSVAGRIPLPSEADECEAMAQQPSITRVLCHIPISTVDQAQDATVPTIRIL